MIEPTLAEQRLITEMRSTFGCLTDLILSGYRLPATNRVRSFYISTSNSTDQISNVISVEASELSGFPQYKEPIVLLALLKLLLEARDGILVNRIDKPAARVRSMLNWAESDESNLIVHSTIRKCSQLHYVRTDFAYDASDNTTQGHVGIYRLLRYCEFSARIAVGKDHEIEGALLEFGENIAMGLRERRLFGVDWTDVTALKPMD
jgi:hypothetical protein